MANSYTNSVNEVTLIGNLGKKPELRYTPNGAEVTTLSVATNQSVPDGNGGYKNVPEWHSVEVWGNTAVACCNFLDKGRKVYVNGRLKTDVSGEGENRRYFTKVKADRILFLDGSNGQQAEVEEAPASEEEIPF